jgi:hypothetical protein
MYAMRYVFLGLIILPAAAFCQTAQPQPSPPALFQQTRIRLLTDAHRMPRYTCLQNITRHFYRAETTEPQSCAAILTKRTQRKHDPPATSWDRLQLDVAIAEDREIHSWPDAPKFNEEEIRKLVSNGPFGSGDFTAFVAGIFGGGGTVKFEGQRTIDGRARFEYRFSVAKDASRYRVATPGTNFTTAYEGSFLLDPQTADLVQLTVRTAELPEATKACQAISEIEYGRIDIHGRQVLIPRETDLRIVYRDGREAIATTSYASCHEYTSKSILRFDAVESATVSAPPRPAVPAANTPIASPFPPGLNFDCRIVTPIDSDTPAGHPIEAILRSPLRGKDKAILAPRGARIHGRLVRLADHKSSLDYFEVGVRLESIEINGAELPLYATLADQAAPPVNPYPGDGREEQLADFSAAPPRNVGVFFFVREQLHLKPFDSAWITTSAETEKGNAAAPNSAIQKLAFSEQHEIPPPPAQVPSQPPNVTAEAPVQSPAAQNSPPPNPTTQSQTATQASSSLPSGTVISAALSKPVDAKKSKVGDKVEARTTAPSTLPGGIVLAQDTRIEGHLSNVKAKSKDSAGSMVEITFDRALTGDGRDLALQATLQAVGRPLTRAPAAMDDSIVSPGTGMPAAGSASGVPPPRGSPGPPPSEPPQVANPDSGAAIPGEHNPDALNADSQGGFGLKGLSLGTSRNASVITSDKGNVHLESGTRLILRIQ